MQHYSLRGRKLLEIVQKVSKTATFRHFLNFEKNLVTLLHTVNLLSEKVVIVSRNGSCNQFLRSSKASKALQFHFDNFIPSVKTFKILQKLKSKGTIYICGPLILYCCVMAIDSEAVRPRRLRIGLSLWVRVTWAV